MFQHFGAGGEPGPEAGGTRPAGPGEPGRTSEQHQFLVESKDPKAELIGEKYFPFIENASHL